MKPNGEDVKKIAEENNFRSIDKKMAIFYREKNRRTKKSEEKRK